MKRLKAVIFSVMIFLWFCNSYSQIGESPIKIFGYFQNEFAYQRSTQLEKNSSSFHLQQLNLFFQKDLARNWTAFVNFELLNSFSTFRQWGAFNLEEAWVKFRLCKEFSLKLGLQIPKFNNLNEIKNKTPLLPYVIRPLVYETSFNEFLHIDEFLPERCFVQAYGFYPVGKVKLDYAFYIGNSPNVNIDSDRGQTGVDTSLTVLLGSRIGIRVGELKAGISITHDNTNLMKGAEKIYGGSSSRFVEVPRYRLGGDFSINFRNFSLQSEIISVTYDDDAAALNYNKKFTYCTVGYQFTETMFSYVSFWKTIEDFNFLINKSAIPESVSDFQQNKMQIVVPTFGMAYNLSDRITLKGQIASSKISSTNPHFYYKGGKFFYFSVAASIIF